MALKPAVKNGVLVRMVRGPDVKFVPFDGPLPVKERVGGIVPVTLVSTIGGLPFICRNPAEGLSQATRMEGSEVVLLGAEITDSVGYKGTVLDVHCTSLNVNIG